MSVHGGEGGRAPDNTESGFPFVASQSRLATYRPYRDFAFGWKYALAFDFVNMLVVSYLAVGFQFAWRLSKGKHGDSMPMSVYGAYRAKQFM